MNNVRAKNLSLKIRFEWSLSGYEVGSIADFPLPVADEGKTAMAQRSKAEGAPLVGIPFASGTASVAPSIAVVKQDLADHLSFARCPEFESPSGFLR